MLLDIGWFVLFFLIIQNTIISWFKIEGNVCYNHVGHGIFLEDGSEMNTYIKSNMVGGSKRWRGVDAIIPGPGVDNATGVIPTDIEYV